MERYYTYGTSLSIDINATVAMKEEMCRLYELTDYQQAVAGWTKWFQATKESKILRLSS